jgi:hypothetical protein
MTNFNAYCDGKDCKEHCLVFDYNAEVKCKCGGTMRVTNPNRDVIFWNNIRARQEQETLQPKAQVKLDEDTTGGEDVAAE